MPHVIDVGIGGVHAPQIVTSFGYDYVAKKYKWISTGEPDWMKKNHKSVVPIGSRLSIVLEANEKF